MIHAFEDFYIDGDPDNYILKYKTKRKDKKGNVIYETRGFFRTIEGTLKSLVQQYGSEFIAGTKKEISLKQAYKEFKAVNNKLDEIISTE